MNEILNPVLAKLVRRVDIEDDELGAAFAEILSGRASDIEAAGFAVALRTKGETTSELATLVRTMLGFATTVSVADGAIDTCGTGGDRAGTVNISTMAALIATAAGARVVKHGNRAASSRCGSADVLEALGIPIELGPAGVEQCVAEVGIGFCLAQRYHPALRFMGPARAALGVPTTFNFLGPLANPARVRRQAVGVADSAMAERVVSVLQANGAEHAWVFYGDDGLDELTTTTTSTVFELRGVDIRRFTLDPADFGFARSDASDLLGGDAAANADAVRAVVEGKPGPIRDIALVNAAAGLVVAGVADDFDSGVQAARAALDTGGAARVLDDWLRVGAAAREAEAD
ncbi:MAG TPA: anthranilate phosphoribosyltransferase [Acidimicrobiia bacterium]|nr:anthranilate phosphoribosyltransferase [Acidimicrobiia bacterium]